MEVNEMRSTSTKLGLIAVAVLLAAIPNLASANNRYMDSGWHHMRMSSVKMVSEPIFFTINGQEKTLSNPPLMEKGKLLVPAREIFTSLGATVDWDSARGVVIISKGSESFGLVIGSAKTMINGGSKTMTNDQSVKLGVPVVLHKGLVYVPIGFIQDVFGTSVAWDPTSRVIALNTMMAGNGPAVAANPSPAIPAPAPEATPVTPGAAPDEITLPRGVNPV
jgi:hypothetical protein